MSDEACKAVTGIGQTKRKLYSDDDDIVYEYKRCLGFNGINISLTEPDALDRSLMIELDRIGKENRKIESEIMAEFLELRSKLLGCIFDVLVKALQIKPIGKLGELPRMADFALWGEAIARALGYKDLEFTQAYYENIGRQNIEAIEAHPLGQTIAKFFEQEEHVEVLESSPLEILERLEKFAEQKKIDTTHKLWPKSHNALTRRLNQIRSNLLEGLGIEVEIRRVTKNTAGRVNTSYIKFRKISPSSLLTPISHNHEQNRNNISGDTLSFGDIISPIKEIPPLERAENRVEDSRTGDTGDTGDNQGTVTVHQKKLPKHQEYDELDDLI